MPTHFLSSLKVSAGQNQVTGDEERGGGTQLGRGPAGGHGRGADLVEAIMRHILQHDGLHGEHVGKLHLRDVEGTHHVGPTWGSGGQGGRPQASRRPDPSQPHTAGSPLLHGLPIRFQCQPGKGNPAPPIHRHTCLSPCLPRPCSGGLADLS